MNSSYHTFTLSGLRHTWGHLQLINRNEERAFIPPLSPATGFIAAAGPQLILCSVGFCFLTALGGSGMPAHTLTVPAASSCLSASGTGIVLWKIKMVEERKYKHCYLLSCSTTPAPLAKRITEVPEGESAALFICQNLGICFCQSHSMNQSLGPKGKDSKKW